MSSFNVLQLVSDELSSNVNSNNNGLNYMQNFNSRKRCAKNIKLAAKAIGNDKSKSDLMPILYECITNSREDDELLYQFSLSLDLEFCKIIGGGSFAALAMLPCLESLICFEESCVRETSLNALKSIIPEFNDQDLSNTIVPLIRRLVENEWFPHKMSGLSIIPNIYSRLQQNDQDALLEIIEKNTQEEIPMVRATVAIVVGELAIKCSSAFNGNQLAQERLLNWYKTLTQDPQKYVRFEMICVTGAITKILGDSDVLLSVMPLMKQFSTERSDRVRIIITNQILTVIQNKSCTYESMVNVINDLIKDLVDEVKISMFNSIPQIFSVLGNGIFFNSISPVIRSVCDAAMPQDKNTLGNASVNVRVALVKLSLKLLDVVSPNDLSAVKECFKIFWDKCLVDTQSHGHAEVRKAVINGLPKIIPILGPEHITSGGGWGRLLRDLFEASKNYVHSNAVGEPAQSSEVEEVDTPKWRVRVAIVEILDHLAKVGSNANTLPPGYTVPEVKSSRLSLVAKKTSVTSSNAAAATETGKDVAIDIWRRAMIDSVNQVRIAAAESLKVFMIQGSAMGGPSVVEQIFLPFLKEYYAKAKNSGSYQNRITFLRSCAILKDNQLMWGKVEEDFIDAIRRDPIANVRISAVKLCANIPNLKDKLGELTAKEDDPDVKSAVRRIIA